jgi:release factor glutamine methyltransferase
LKKAHHEWQVTGIDISEDAIEVAKENAKRNGVEVEFKVADIFGIQNTEYRLQTDFDIVVSNPPYICESEKSSMRPNVLAYEPASALFVPDNDPLKFYRRIAELKMGKYLFFEINEAYPQELADMLKELGYEDIQITNDIYGKPRIIEARMA